MIINIVHKRVISIFFIGIIVGSIYLFTEKNKEYPITQESIAMSEEFYSFEGKWIVREYIDSIVELHEVDTDSEEYKRDHEEYVLELKEKYEDFIFEINEDSVEYFGGGSELGYYYEDYSELFLIYRQPPTLEIVPPFLCASVKLKESDEWFDIIIDGNGEAIFEAGYCFFKLERVDVNVSETNSIILAKIEPEENMELGQIKSAIFIDGKQWMIVLDEHGNVWNWKKNETKEDAVQISEMKNVIEIVDTGYGAFYALTKEGDVYAWGTNFGGIINPGINILKEDPELVKRKELPDIVNIDAGLGSAFAVDRKGRLYAWGLGRLTVFEQDMTPGLFEENQDLIGNVKEVYPGTWRYHFFKREDGSLFSIMSLEKLNAKAKTYFLFPYFGGDEPVTDWRNDERVFDIRGAEENDLVILYEMGTRDDIVFLANDDCTMYMYLEDGTLWYWNNDRITYYNKEVAGASVELRGYDYNGSFENVDIRSILGIMDESVDTPKIIDICSGRDGVLFLLEDGQVFASEYVTKEVRDVEYYTFEDESNSQEGESATAICYQMRLKELSFRKLEYENIISINSDESKSFYLVDESGNIYCYYAIGDSQE